MIVSKTNLDAMRGLKAAAAALGADAVRDLKKDLWGRIRDDHDLPTDGKFKIVTSDSHYAGEIRDARTGAPV